MGTPETSHGPLCDIKSRLICIVNPIIKTTSVCDVMQVVSVMGLAGCAWSTRLAAVTLSGRGARVYTCTCVHDNIPCRRLAK